MKKRNSVKETNLCHIFSFSFWSGRFLGSITSRCSGNEPALLLRKVSSRVWPGRATKSRLSGFTILSWQKKILFCSQNQPRSLEKDIKNSKYSISKFTLFLFSAILKFKIRRFVSLRFAVLHVGHINRYVFWQSLQINFPLQSCSIINYHKLLSCSKKGTTSLVIRVLN